jgi:Kinesin motor domain
VQVISDLLKPERTNLGIREDRKRGIYVDGLSEWVVRTPEEVRPGRCHATCWPYAHGTACRTQAGQAASSSRNGAQCQRVLSATTQVYGLMERGAEQRATGATKLNEMSSRSHAVRTLECNMHLM